MRSAIWRILSTVIPIPTVVGNTSARIRAESGWGQNRHRLFVSFRSASVVPQGTDGEKPKGVTNVILPHAMSII
jgi:hypothetical protein